MNLLLATSLVLLLVGINVTSGRARHSIGRFNKRIINGMNAELYDIPYQVGLFFRYQNEWSLMCGGVLIKPNKVLTAAHCMEGETAMDTKVSVGLLNQYGPPNRFEQFINVKKIKIHEDFQNANLRKDLAILTLATRAKLNKNVKVAQLADNSSTFFDTLCIISGWGVNNYIRRKPTTPNRLQKTSITLLSQEECISYLQAESDRINDGQLVCLLNKQDELSKSCFGDSGGPLFCGPNLDKLVGISSFLLQNCTSDYPVVYTDVTKYFRSWIETNS